MDAIREFWTFIVAAIGAIFWLARLEGRVTQACEEIDRLEKQMDNDRADAKASRAETNDLLKELRQDVKRLLERNSAIR